MTKVRFLDLSASCTSLQTVECHFLQKSSQMQYNSPTFFTELDPLATWSGLWIFGGGILQTLQFADRHACFSVYDIADASAMGLQRQQNTLFIAWNGPSRHLTYCTWEGALRHSISYCIWCTSYIDPFHKNERAKDTSTAAGSLLPRLLNFALFWGLFSILLSTFR